MFQYEFDDREDAKIVKIEILNFDNEILNFYQFVRLKIKTMATKLVLFISYYSS